LKQELLKVQEESTRQHQSNKALSQQVMQLKNEVVILNTQFKQVSNEKEQLKSEGETLIALVAKLEDDIKVASIESKAVVTLSEVVFQQ
jgi:uncharacterized protein (DUF3084 family)